MNRYMKEYKSNRIDVYDILKAYEVTHPCVQHAVKKLLANGTGEKDRNQNIQEALECLQRWRDMETPTEQPGEITWNNGQYVVSRDNDIERHVRDARMFTNQQVSEITRDPNIEDYLEDY